MCRENKRDRESVCKERNRVFMSRGIEKECVCREREREREISFAKNKEYRKAKSFIWMF